MVNVFKFVFNTQFVVSKHDHIQHSQQKLETILTRLEAVLKANDDKYINKLQDSSPQK